MDYIIRKFGERETMEPKDNQKGYSGERLVWMFFVAVLLCSTAFFFFRAHRLQSQVYDTSKQLLDVDSVLADQSKSMADLTQMIQVDSGKSVQVVPVLSKNEADSLNEKGIGQPYKDLPADLIKHPDLVSYMVGDDFKFVSTDKMCVLGPNRVWAFVTDGKVGRGLLLSYVVNDDGIITWRAIGETKAK